ncbi:MAG: signal peptidase II [Ignavibacteria bacterium]|nr:signal peptidase II [Ignavibacteria bacterium]
MKLIFISILILLADQFSKIYVKGFYLPLINLEHPGLVNSKSIPIIDKFFYITPVENPGIAFGIDLGPEVKTFVSILTIIATLGLIVYLFRIRKEDFFSRLSIIIILGGALGNLTDRIFYGYFYGYSSLLSGNVVDFLDLRLFRFFFPNNVFSIHVFNIADVAIILGVITLLFALSRNRKIARQNSIDKIENSLSLD